MESGAAATAVDDDDQDSSDEVLTVDEDKTPEEMRNGVSQKDTDDFSKEVLEQDLGLSNSTDSFDATRPAAELMEGTRSQIAKIFGSRAATAENILEQRVTDALQKFVAENYEGREEKTAMRAIKKGNLRKQEIVTRLSERKLRPFKNEKNWTFTKDKLAPLRPSRDYLEGRIDTLQELREEKARIEKEELENLAREWNWLDSISAENLEEEVQENGDFFGLGKDVFVVYDNKKYRVSDFLDGNKIQLTDPENSSHVFAVAREKVNFLGNLKSFLSPREIENWKENETTRILMRHLQTENFQRILNGQPINGVETHFGESPESESLNREKREIKDSQEKDWKSLSDFLKDFGISDVNGKSVGSVDVQSLTLQQLEELSQLIYKNLFDKEISSEGLQKIVAGFEKQIEAERRKAERLEEEKKRIQRDIDFYQKEFSKISDAFKKAKGDEQQGLSSEVTRIQTNLKNLNRDLKTVENDIIKKNEEIEKLENGLGEKVDAENEKRLEAKNAIRETEAFQKKSERANELIESLSAGVKRKKEIETRISESREPADKTDSRTLFTRLMVERAKVDECRRLGKKDTADLSKSAADRARRIGEMSAKMRLENWSAGAIKKRNFAELKNIAEQNKKPGMRGFLKKTAEVTGRVLLGKEDSRRRQGLKEIKEDASKIGAASIFGPFMKAFQEEYGLKK